MIEGQVRDNTRMLLLKVSQLIEVGIEQEDHSLTVTTNQAVSLLASLDRGDLRVSDAVCLHNFVRGLGAVPAMDVRVHGTATASDSRHVGCVKDVAILGEAAVSHPEVGVA